MYIKHHARYIVSAHKYELVFNSLAVPHGSMPIVFKAFVAQMKLTTIHLIHFPSMFTWPTEFPMT